MTEIKCRAWGGHEVKYFVYFDLFDGTSDEYFTDETIQPDGSRHVLDKSNVEMVQLFIGLPDKNGKEIYDGDLLKLDSWSEIQQVKFVEGAFCLSSVKEKYSDYTSDIHYINHAGIPQATVIGNIYENPDLLQ